MRLFGFDCGARLCLSVDKYYAYDYDYFNMKPHAHVNAEFMCVESGECEIHAGHEGTLLRLKRGQFFAAASGVPHRLVVKRGTRCKMLNLELRPAPDGLDMGGIIGSSPPLFEVYKNMPEFFMAADTSGVMDVIRLVHAELTSGEYNLEPGYRVQALLLELAIAAARSYRDNRDGSVSYIRAAQDFIRREYANGIGAAEVAASVGLNPIYLQRQIKRHTGKTILEHINFYRIGQARKLLENTALPLVDIAAECGFNSRQSFYETFLRFEGVSPRAFRTSRRELAASRYRQADFEWAKDSE